MARSSKGILYMSEWLRVQLAAEAEKMERTASWVAQQALKEYLVRVASEPRELPL